MALRWALHGASTGSEIVAHAPESIELGLHGCLDVLDVGDLLQFDKFELCAWAKTATWIITSTNTSHPTPPPTPANEHHTPGTQKAREAKPDILSAWLS